MLSEVLQVIDLANLTVALSSLVIALVALRVSNRVATASITQPFVIQELYELYEYVSTRRLGSDPVADVPRLFEEIGRVRSRRLILEQAGFGDRMAELEAKIHEFSELRGELEIAQRAGALTEEQGKKLGQAAAAIDYALQALLRDIEPQLRSVMKNPLRAPG
jgi:hypothetical protein